MKFEPSLHKPLLCLAAIFALAATKPAWAAEIAFEEGIEYANPDGQHLQLNIAKPKKSDGSFPAVICIHGGGFRAGKREGYDAQCIRLAQHGYVFPRARLTSSRRERSSASTSFARRSPLAAAARCSWRKTA